MRESPAPEAWDLPVTMEKPLHQPHLENFFDAIRNGTPLNCPSEVGFATAVTILKVNEAVENNADSPTKNLNLRFDRTVLIRNAAL